ncbi:MAG: DUF3987 domain-containing protein [Nitrospirae bacterium]|nr:DUF3987 domain-containing protein [Nitrospirota bacterium]
MLTGYHNNTDYTNAKKPFSNNGKWNYVDDNEIEAHVSKKHWIGGVIPDGYILLDIDNKMTGKNIFDGLIKSGYSFLALETPNGYQFVFKDTGKVNSQRSKVLTLAGVVVDYRTANKGYTVLPTENTPGRTVIHIPEDEHLEAMPLCFIPVRQRKDTDEELDKIDEGSRDDQMFRHASKIREWNISHRLNLTHDEKRRVLCEINRIFCYPPLSEQEIDKKLQSSEGYPSISTPHTAIQDEWTNPIPFDDYSNLPDFPIFALPDLGCEIVKNVSEVNQVDTGLTAASYLSVLSACIAKKSEINLVTHREPLNIFTCSILPSGERKSSTQNVFTKPLYEYQEREQSERADKIRGALNSQKIREARLAKLQKQAAHADNQIERNKIEKEAAEVAKDIQENPVPKKPIYCVDDVTIEALEIQMTDNDERMSIFSTEGGIFQNMAGRYSDKKTCNIDLYLKAHSGDPCSNYRVGRESKTMLSPSLTMCLTVQPDVIREIGTNQQFRGKGLLARILFSYCRKQVGNRGRQVNSIPEHLLNQYREHVFSLMKIPLSMHTLTLTPDAQLLWDEFYNDVEKDMRQGGSLEYLTDWGSKLPGAVARIAGLLHFAEHGKGAVSIPVSVSIVSASCVIGAYFKEHALATFGFMKADHRIESAKEILDYLQRHKPDSFKGRDIMRNTTFKTMDDFIPGLKILMERDYIREKDTSYSGMGRPQAREYEFNPKILEKH